MGNKTIQKSPSDPRERGNQERQHGARSGSNDNGIMFPIPKEVTKGIRWEQCENFSLLFYRFLPYLPDGSIDKKNIWESSGLEARGNELWRERQEVKDFLKRQKDLEKSLLKMYGKENVCCLKGTTLSRLVVGMGNKNSLEIGMTLHRLYGIPYLPATALKGISLAWAVSLGTEDELLKKGFGSQKGIGKIEFYDAFPMEEHNGPLFQKDVINVHYHPYYGDKTKPPADYYNPVPTYFLTVPEGVPFRIFLSSKEGEKDILTSVSNWLINGLREFGIGAKTSVGYGEIEISQREGT